MAGCQCVYFLFSHDSFNLNLNFVIFGSGYNILTRFGVVLILG